MLSEDEVEERAIRHYALAVNAGSAGYDTGATFAKAQAYLSVLDMPYSNSCGAYSQQNFMEYSESLARAFNKLDLQANIEFNAWLDDNININFWKEL